MQFQVQTLATKNELTQRDVDDLDIFVGLHSPLNSPYNIFLRLKDIETNSDIIYFYAYSIGKQRAIIWGLYDRTGNQFLIDNACKYSPNDLKIIIDTWKNNKYEFFFTAMRNRVSSRLAQFGIYGDNRNKMITLIENFKKLYLTKLMISGLLSSNGKNINGVPFDENLYNEVLNQVYSAGIEAVNEDNLKPTLELLFDNIESGEDTEAIRKAIGVNDWNNITPYQMNVAKHILVHLFLMTFLTIDEYRVVKYIDYNGDNNIKLMNAIKGTFMYEWLLEFGKVLRIYNLEKFMVDISKDIIRLIEAKINLTNIGVIGGPSIGSNLESLLESLSVIFEDFISKSIYSKISYVNNLTPCPSIKICEAGNKDECNLYSHGYGTRSKYDLT